MVEVEILKGESSIVTTGQISVAFYQAQAVTDKIQGRTLRAGVYTQSGKPALAVSLLALTCQPHFYEK